MAVLATILNTVPQTQSLSAPRALAGSSNSSTSGNTTDTGSNITANDFLTLLVTEMKNQDPTSAQDPMQYINQLVGVNSLQQLIQINETLSGALSPTAQAQPVTGIRAEGSIPVNQPVANSAISGNLAIPQTSPAAHRVATALGQHASRF